MKSLIYITGVVLLLTSCLGTKKVQETKHEVFSEVKQDSISIQKKEIEIIPTLVQEESFTIPLEVAEQMEDFEKRISTQEGKASAAISKKGNTITIRNIIPGSKNQKTETNTKVTKEITFEERIDAYIEKRIASIPWYLWLGAIVFLFRGFLWNVLCLIFPGLQILNFKK
ncbi:hypothetical protein UJ101_02492 [Flavobacteriaceae bacterium UJ101]|nr:hypothetical protein UJ101_02492 [Flavobacteriaceae bacterium UJ101]